MKTAGGLLGGLLVGWLLALAPAAAAETSTPTPTGTATSPDGGATPEATPPAAQCDARASFEHQLVRCRAEGLEPGGAVVLRVHLHDAAAPTPVEWVGGVRAQDDGTAGADVALPCDTTGTTTAELAGPTPDGGRFRHRVALELPGRCAESPLVPPDAWGLLASALVGVSVLVVGLGAWRHRTRRRRVSDPGRRTPRGRGPRRSPRPPRRRRSRARRRRRRRRR